MLLRKIAPYFAHLFISFIGLTSKISYKGLHHAVEARKSGGFIFALWHQRQVFFSYTHSNTNCHALISRSKDGDVIAKILSLFGLGTVRGSSSRSGSRAMFEMLSLIDRGDTIAITPDGPKGPKEQVKSGILFLALKSGKAIIPSANALSWHWKLKKSWDWFHVPMPFSRIYVAHGSPIFVTSEADFERAGLALELGLKRVTAEADRLASAGWFGILPKKA